MNSRTFAFHILPRVAFCAFILCAAALPAADKLPPARKRTLVLVDDHDIFNRSGTERVFHAAVKHAANPLIAEEKLWEKAIAWNTVHRDPKTGKYQLWYQAYAGRGSAETHPKTHDCVVAYAESDDGIKFTKPNLGLHAFRDIKDTNIVLLGNGGHGDRYGCSVVVDPREADAARRYKMAYYDWSKDGEREYAGLHLAFSPDGIHWTKRPGLIYRTSFGARGMQPPLAGGETYHETPGRSGTTRKTWTLPGTMSDAADLMYDPKRKCFAIYGKMWFDGPDGSMGWKHGLGRTESADLLAWSRPQLVMVPDEFDPPIIEFHTAPVFYHAGRYYCLNQLLDRRKEGGIEIELDVSRDGIEWARPFRKDRLLKRGAPGSFDAGSLFTNATPVMLGDEMRFYYGAYGSTAIGGGEAIEGRQQPSGVGLATMPRDRFAGLRPVPLSDQPTLKKPLEHVAQITFKPLDFAGCSDIVINADAAGGSVTAELLTVEGYRVPGFDRENCQPLVKNAIRQRVVWKNKKLDQLPPAGYMVRLHLKKAEVFAITFR